MDARVKGRLTILPLGSGGRLTLDSELGQEELIAFADRAFEDLRGGRGRPPASRGPRRPRLLDGDLDGLPGAPPLEAAGDSGAGELALVDCRIEEPLHELAIIAMGTRLGKCPADVTNAVEGERHRGAPGQGPRGGPALPRPARSAG